MTEEQRGVIYAVTTQLDLLQHTLWESRVESDQIALLILQEVLFHLHELIREVNGVRTDKPNY